MLIYINEKGQRQRMLCKGNSGDTVVLGASGGGFAW
jgi:hypothetical protein